MALTLCETLEAVPSLGTRVRKQFGKNLRSLVHYPNLTDDFIALAKRFDASGGWPEGWAAVRGAAKSLQRSNNLEKAVKFDALARSLAPTGLSARIASYVLPERWSPLDIAEVEFD